MEVAFLYSTNCHIQKQQSLLFSLFLIHHYWSAEKEFDVFLSFVWPRTSSQLPPGTNDEGEHRAQICEPTRCHVTFNHLTTAGCSNSNLLNCGKGGATEGPLEALLPQVLEEWGHRLCLLERDVLPGGGQMIRHPCAIMRVRGLTLISPVLFQCIQMMWSSLSRGARC